MSFFITKENAFGLDVSDYNLRLVQLAKKGKKNHIQIYNDISLPQACVVDGEIKNQKVFIEYFHKLIKTKIGAGALARNVACSLPDSKTFLKQITIDICEDSLIKDKINEILPQYLPIAIDEIYMDYQILKKNETSIDILIGASPKNIVDQYMEVIDLAGYIPAVLEVEAAAISRLLIEQGQEIDSQIIIDIGATRTGLFLYDENAVKFTISLPISGDKITQTISEALELDKDKAEKAKIVCGLDSKKCDGALLEIFSETIDELCSRIIGAIDHYKEDFNNSSNIKKITLCGGGANFLGIGNLLEQKLNIKVEIANPFFAIENKNMNYFTPQRSQSFITAIGLALRGI